MTSATASTRDLIVRAADRLFPQRSFDAMAFAGVAEAVRMSRGNFHHHFKAKDGILGAVVARRLAGTRAMRAAWEAAGGASPRARIGRFAPTRRHPHRSAPCASCCRPLPTRAHQAAPHMPGHEAWLPSGFDGGVFLLAGRLHESHGGMVLARVQADPLAIHGVVRAQVLGVTACLVDERLAFLRESDAATTAAQP